MGESEEMRPENEDTPAAQSDPEGTLTTSNTKRQVQIDRDFDLSKGFPRQDQIIEKDNSQEPFDKKAYERKLVAEVLVRYWKLKEKQQHEGSANSPDRNISGPLSLHEEDCKLPAQPVTSSSGNDSDRLLSEYNKPPACSSQTQTKPNAPARLESNNAACITSPKIERLQEVVPLAHPAAITHPISPDVLFGRRQAQRKHPGNVRLRELCHEFQREYRNGDRGHKTAITWRIVHMIQHDGGRFLKFDPVHGNWREVENDMAREKVAFTIRDTFHQLPLLNQTI